MHPTYAIHIRPGTATDVPEAFRLVKELAEFENGLAELVNTPAQMLTDFQQERYAFLVAEVAREGEPAPIAAGIALYYYAYSTWKGRFLYLEDIVVTESFRGKGIGKRLFEAVVLLAQQEKMGRMAWQVLDWNQSAIVFYEKFGATMHQEWLNARLTAEQLQSFQAEP